MEKTTKVAADRAKDQTKTVLPAEYARGVHIQNAPSLRALKLMHLMIATAGGRMADNVRHNMLLSEINSIEGMSHHDRNTLKPLFEELRAAVLTYEDFEEMYYTIGGFLDLAVVGYSEEGTEDTLVSWQFGQMFKDMAAASTHWALLDRQTVFHFGSKYSLLLFQHISSLIGLKHTQSKNYSIREIRAVFGLEQGKAKRFSDLNRNILQTAINEINQLARFTLTSKPQKKGRSVVAVEISWESKPVSKPAKKRTGSPQKRISSNGSAIPTTPAKTFPATGTIEFSKPWNEIAKLNGNGKDKDLIATDFRNWCQARNIPLDGPNIEKAFKGFCKKAMP